MTGALPEEGCSVRLFLAVIPAGNQLVPQGDALPAGPSVARRGAVRARASPPRGLKRCRVEVERVKVREPTPGRAKDGAVVTAGRAVP